MEFDILIAQNVVSLLHIAAPGIDAADAPHGAADGDDGAGGLGQLLQMDRLLQLVGGIGDGGEVEGLVLHIKPQLASVHPEGGPEGSHMVAAFLGHQVIGDVGHFRKPSGLGALK